jgi:hypothetical protein
VRAAVLQLEAECAVVARAVLRDRLAAQRHEQQAQQPVADRAAQQRLEVAVRLGDVL